LGRRGDRWAQNGGTESLGRAIAGLNSLVNFGNAYTGYTSGTNIYGESIRQGQATVELAFGFLGMVPGGAGGATKGSSSTIYRAVSKAELDDIAKFGFRNKAGAYETGKLFAPTAKEAAQFGRNNFIFDNLPVSHYIYINHAFCMMI